jgi:hypothetical protein
VTRSDSEKGGNVKDEKERRDGEREGGLGTKKRQ